LTVQEPHKHQVEYIAAQLPDYAWVGSGRCPVVFGIGEEVSLCAHTPPPGGGGEALPPAGPSGPRSLDG
jgi:hypothetical protein